MEAEDEEAMGGEDDPSVAAEVSGAMGSHARSQAPRMELLISIMPMLSKPYRSCVAAAELICARASPKS